MTGKSFPFEIPEELTPMVELYSVEKSRHRIEIEDAFAGKTREGLLSTEEGRRLWNEIYNPDGTLKPEV